MTPTSPQSERIRIDEEADISIAINTVLQIAFDAGMNKVDRTMLATSVSELATNIIRYGENGYIEISLLDGEAQTGIRVVAEDKGPGIVDIAAAMRDGFSTTKSMGVGLPGVKRMSDTFDIESQPGKGTIITVEKYL